MMNKVIADSSFVKKRRPWIAALMNLFASPLGHIYSGRPARGIVAVSLNVVIAASTIFFSVRATTKISFSLLMCLLLLVYLGVVVDAYIIARQTGNSFQLRPYNRWYAYLMVLSVIVIVGEGIKSIYRSKVVQAYKIPSDAMAPTLVSGDHVMTDKTAYRSRSPERFDVVVFEYPEDAQKTFAKRVIGLPGETIELRNNTVWINGSKLQEPYLHSAARAEGPEKSLGDSFGPLRIPEGNYFLLGDNRTHSYDSRFWGPVARDRIWGRVSVIYFSWASDKVSVRWDRIGAAVK